MFRTLSIIVISAIALIASACSSAPFSSGTNASPAAQPIGGIEAQG